MPIAVVVQLVVADLEQVVARVGVQDVVERLGQVPARRQRGALTHRRDLAAQQRDLLDTRAL